MVWSLRGIYPTYGWNRLHCFNIIQDGRIWTHESWPSGSKSVASTVEKIARIIDFIFWTSLEIGLYFNISRSCINSYVDYLTFLAVGAENDLYTVIKLLLIDRKREPFFNLFSRGCKTKVSLCCIAYAFCEIWNSC